MLVQKFLAILIQKFIRFKELRNYELIVRQSGLFDKDYYISNYPEIGEQGKKNPIKHYLLKGAELGFNPSSSFDSSWYEAQYEDVKYSEINPLVHYVLHGLKEGRKTHKNQPLTPFESAVERLKNSVVESLWGGYSSPALEELRNLYSDSAAQKELRFLAAWHSARWFYFTENYGQALKLSKFVRELSPQYLTDKTALLMHSFCLNKVGEHEEAGEVLKEFLRLKPDDADILLALSNLKESPLERLDLINQAYEKNGFLGVNLSDFNAPTCFHNLSASAPKVCDERLVSIIIPTFNAGSRLEIAVNSLLNQSWQNIEVIVVDDCSTDNTTNIVEELIAKDHRVKLVRQERNGGAYRARNAGLKLAKGCYITTHDGDDWSHPQKIERQIRYLDENSKVMGVSTHWVRATEDLYFQHNWRLNTRLIHWSHSSFLFRREALEKLAEWDEVIAGGDTEFIWRMQAEFGKEAFSKIVSEVPLAFALDDNTSLTRNKATHIKTMHNGLRHIYREACSWWHRQSVDSFNIASIGERPFPAPKPLVTRGDNSVKSKFVFISDFTEEHNDPHDVNLIKFVIDRGAAVILYHIPNYGNKSQKLANSFFELLMHKNAEVCVFGMNVETENTVVLNPTLLDYVPENLASITSESVLIKSDSIEKVRSEKINKFVSFVETNLNVVNKDMILKALSKFV